ncbi:hypothetical protein D922_04380 [Enterococcus faecalis 06-MB-DW-09]|nr:hypothetical protein D931_02593 [Enterococcus faecium 13.SD.W.09]EPH87450.1 hypothetical protein D922_04380 [Enterococcus faecalis 06-MB-DW-09]
MRRPAAAWQVFLCKKNRDKSKRVNEHLGLIGLFAFGHSSLTSRLSKLVQQKMKAK